MGRHVVVVAYVALTRLGTLSGVLAKRGEPRLNAEAEPGLIPRYGRYGYPRGA